MRCEHCQAKLGKHSGASHVCPKAPKDEPQVTHFLNVPAGTEERVERAKADQARVGDFTSALSPKPRRRRRKSETPD